MILGNCNLLFLYLSVRCDYLYNLFPLFCTVQNVCIWYYKLLVLSGDIHPNPGPESNSSFNDTIDALNQGLSIMHINIQSLRQKITIAEVEFQPYDVVVISETWLSSEIDNRDLHLTNFHPPIRCDRQV